VKYYRCYLLTHDDHIAGARILECADDAEAKRQGREIIAAERHFAAVEIWNGAPPCLSISGRRGRLGAGSASLRGRCARPGSGDRRCSERANRGRSSPAAGGRRGQGSPTPRAAIRERSSIEDAKLGMIDCGGTLECSLNRTTRELGRRGLIVQILGSFPDRVAGDPSSSSWYCTRPGKRPAMSFSPGPVPALDSLLFLIPRQPARNNRWGVTRLSQKRVNFPGEACTIDGIPGPAQ
jgi:hypothetical protein